MAWRMLSHITNKHEWALSHGAGVNRCLHEPLTAEERNKPWLSDSEHAHVLTALSGVILDRRLLAKVLYYLNYRSTAELEVFHQLILMYCAKRFSYSPPVYRVRNRLAAMDHNHNADRPLRRNKKGEVMYQRCYQKKSARWSVHPIKSKKNYSYVNRLAQIALQRRIADKKGMSAPAILEPADPRRIASHLAPTAPQPTDVLVKDKTSRFTDK